MDELLKSNGLLNPDLFWVGVLVAVGGFGAVVLFMAARGK
jgi:hypothetical protein